LYHQSFHNPNEIKKGLEDLLLGQDVPFVFSSYVSDILMDVTGKPAGVVMANRSGEQVIRAKMVVDATERATGARLMGVNFTKYRAGKHLFEFTVLGNRPQSKYSPQKLKPPVHYDGQSFYALRYRLHLSMKDACFAAFAEAEHKARDMTWDADQVDASDRLFQIPPDHIQGEKHHDNHDSDGEDFSAISLDCFRPEEHPALCVLGDCADLSREASFQTIRQRKQMGARLEDGVVSPGDPKSWRRDMVWSPGLWGCSGK